VIRIHRKCGIRHLQISIPDAADAGRCVFALSAHCVIAWRSARLFVRLIYGLAAQAARALLGFGGIGARENCERMHADARMQLQSRAGVAVVPRASRFV
jgi:hypothetical protein